MKITIENREYEVSDSFSERIESFIKKKILKHDIDFRQECLSGEWFPNEIGNQYWFINNDVNNLGTNIKQKYTKHGKNYAYFPTRELAKEYQLIKQGKWKPKNGDTVFELAKEHNLCFESYKRPLTSDDKFYFMHAEGKIFFPTEEQRQQYIVDKKDYEIPPAYESLRDNRFIVKIYSVNSVYAKSIIDSWLIRSCHVNLFNKNEATIDLIISDSIDSFNRNKLINLFSLDENEKSNLIISVDTLNSNGKIIDTIKFFNISFASSLSFSLDYKSNEATSYHVTFSSTSYQQTQH